MPICAPDFEFVRALVHDRAGIVLEHGKEYLVESRLQPVVRHEGLLSIAELVSRLRQRTYTDLLQQVINAMTTNETSFFRDVGPFDALRTHVLPALIESRSQSRTLAIWYAASSTGQEPYSVSMMIREHFPALLGWDLRQVATDISPDVVARARAGTYSQVEVNRGLPVRYLTKYFEQRGNEWQLHDDVRRMVRFDCLNLMGPWPGIVDIDIVMIRNVLIYFDLEAKRDIFRRVRRIMRRDGFMFLGGAETTRGLDEAFVRQEYERAGCYRLREGTPAASRV